MRKKVVIGMSGGVDSSAAAYLLREQNYDVIGVTMRTWRDEAQDGIKRDRSGPGLRAEEDAKRVAETLGIPHFVLDFSGEFQCKVIDYFVEEYLRGHTPNPCVVCNRHVKWEALLSAAKAMGADYIATGHYARIERMPNGRFAVRNSVTAKKDQTYALCYLTQEQLAHTLMPLGEYEKEQVRDMAERAGLDVAGKPDSQEICFVPDDDYAGFIDREASGRIPPPGDFITGEGRVLGRHKGITHYTVGQRRGLELPMGERVYVTDIRPDTDEVVVGNNEELFSTEVLCKDVNYMAVTGFEFSKRIFAKIRYNHRGEYCRAESLPGGLVRAVFERPVRAAAPGQSICFYEDGYVLGGGVIQRQK